MSSNVARTNDSFASMQARHNEFFDGPLRPSRVLSWLFIGYVLAILSTVHTLYAVPISISY